MQPNIKPPTLLAMPAHDAGRCVWDAGAALGEGALWSPSQQALYWVDILGRRVHRFHPHSGKRHSWDMAEEVSALAERQAGQGLVLALRRGLARWDSATADQAPSYFCHLDKDLPGNRCNDGKCDEQGRFWIGTMDFGCTLPTGSLYLVTADGRTTQQDQGFAVTNGPTWLKDQATLLFNDTVRGRVLAYDVDSVSARLSNRRVWLQLESHDGVPDGMCTDAAGRVWICHWGGGCVSCHDPRDARELGRIALPASQVTSCAFGGVDLCTLFVTTARVGLPPNALNFEPLAGGLFAFSLDESGCIANKFAG